MSARLPHTISNQSLTFFVKGKPYSLTKGHEHFEVAKNLLQSPGAHPVQQLVEMVDARQALLRDSHGALQFIGADLVFKGRVLEGLWVNKIKQFRAAGEPFAPLFNALGSLVQNPTEAAIDRLPVFLEKSNLGFLEDGRFIAYKAVKEDYFDIHTGCTFRNMIGDTPHMPRADVDANPNSCCSTGLHVGTPEYVKDFGLGNVGRRVMLIAVWPHDVVSVPYSYDGTKMRICAYEVLDELDEIYAGTTLGRPVITPRTQIPALPEGEPAVEAEAVEADEDEVEADEDDEDIVVVDETTLSIAEQAVVDDRVTIRGSWNVIDGDYTVTAVDEASTCRLCVKPARGSSVWIGNQCVVAILPRTGVEATIDVEPLVEVEEPEVILAGDLVEVTGEGWPPAGIYPALHVGRDAQIQTEYDGVQTAPAHRVKLHQSRPWMRAEIGGTVDLRATGTVGEAFRNGGRDIEVVDRRLDGPTPQLQIRTGAGPWWVAAERVTAAYPAD